MLNIADYLSEEELHKVIDKYNVSDIEAHEVKVSGYALRLLDSLKPYYEFKDEERNLLHYSALLHDIGYFINKKNHQKHTKYIILEEPLLDNVPRNLRDNLAFIASSHGKFIDDAVDFYPHVEKATLIKLISLLRIADALDHSHKMNVLLETVEIKNHILNIKVRGEGCNIILKKIKKKSYLFSKIYNIPIYVECS